MGGRLGVHTHTHAQAYICVCVFRFTSSSKVAVGEILSLVILRVPFCMWSIYYMSVRPGRGIPPLWLFLRFLPSLFLGFLTGLTQYGKFLLTRNEGLRTKDVVLCTHCKALWHDVTVGCINKMYWSPEYEETFIVLELNWDVIISATEKAH